MITIQVLLLWLMYLNSEQRMVSKELARVDMNLTTLQETIMVTKQLLTVQTVIENTQCL